MTFAKVGSDETRTFEMTGFGDAVTCRFGAKLRMVQVSANAKAAMITTTLEVRAISVRRRCRPIPRWIDSQAFPDRVAASDSRPNNSRSRSSVDIAELLA
jgi:hypothetical protein